MVKDGEIKEGWVLGSWLFERGLEDQIFCVEVQEELEVGLDEDILQDLSFEVFELEFQWFKDIGEGILVFCIIVFVDYEQFFKFCVM